MTLTEISTLDAKSLQAAKLTSCVECGISIEYRTVKRLRCKTCAAAQRRSSQRKTAEHQRRRRGIVLVKGAVASCDRCGSEIVRITRTHRFCDECAPVAALDYSREYQRNRHRADGREQVGSNKKCMNCCSPFHLERKGRQFYCPPCMELSAARKLPSNRLATRRWHKNRWASDPVFAINGRMRRAIGNSLGGTKAGRSWESLVDYTVDQLKTHLERQFLPGMSWENRGEWQIDHITPLALFNFKTAECPDFRAAWALTNLRPLWERDNLEKRDKRLYLL